MKSDPTPIIPAIVVVGYNRPRTLKRMFSSLLIAEYPKGVNIPLVISLDYCAENIASEVKELADKMLWPHGTKDVISHPDRLGLKDHILTCGDLTEKYESVIVLEDDLFLSPGFYNYSLIALNFFKDDTRISGISLYSHQSNPYLRKVFCPLDDGGDNFFLQFASSWGQVWDKEQWRSFRDWYGNGKKVYDTDMLPDEVIAWPDTSWLKLFIKYMVECHKVFVYPRGSLSTNFGDPGTHFLSQNPYFQVPILLQSKKYNFVSLNDSLSVYDAFFELEVRVLNKLTNCFLGKEYTVDTYGSKNPSKVKVANMLTIQECVSPEYAFGNVMKPAIANVFQGISGEDISFCKTEYIVKKKYHTVCCCKFFNKNLIGKSLCSVFGKMYKRITKRLSH